MVQLPQAPMALPVTHTETQQLNNPAHPPRTQHQQGERVVELPQPALARGVAVDEEGRQRRGQQREQQRGSKKLWQVVGACRDG